MAYLTAPERLETLLPGEPRYRADQLRDWLYRAPVLDTAAMTNLPLAIRAELAESLWPFEPEVDRSADDGQTRKWLFRAPDGASIETVLMGYSRRTTLCLSSQVGCAMGCTFCATGQFSFERHLEAGEIVAQLAYAEAFLRSHGLPASPPRVTNVVFMGMGEPLANYERVREALRRMIEVMGRSPRSITVSTVGVSPGIRRLAQEPWSVNLAVSLHAADDQLRSTLVPLNVRYPLGDVLDAAEQYFASTGRRVSIEWTLIAGVNDDVAQARKLASIAKRLHAHVNVIAMNPTPLAEAQAPRDDTVERFIAAARDAGANVTRRDTRGRDIDAACGQLRLRQEGRRTGPAATVDSSSPVLTTESKEDDEARAR